MTITNGYCTLAELKEAERLNITAATYDTALEGVIEAVSRAIDYACARYFWKDTNDTTRYFTPLDTQYVLVGDLVSITTLSVDNSGDRSYETWTVDTDYELWPYNALLGTEQRPYMRVDVAPQGGKRFYPGISKGLKIVGKFGWPAVPKAVKEACLIWSMRTYKRYATPLGVSAMTALGEMSVKVPPPDPDVAHLLSPFVLQYVG